MTRTTQILKHYYKLVNRFHVEMETWTMSNTTNNYFHIHLPYSPKKIKYVNYNTFFFKKLQWFLKNCYGLNSSGEQTWLGNLRQKVWLLNVCFALALCLLLRRTENRFVICLVYCLLSIVGSIVFVAQLSLAIKPRSKFGLWF